MSSPYLYPFLGAVTINTIVWIISSILRTDKFYDLTGSLSYLLTLIIGLNQIPVAFSSSFTSEHTLVFSIHQLLVAGMLSIWAIRLGTFLFTRILHDGFDRRLQFYLDKPLRFFFLWFMQTLWVFIGTLPILKLYSVTYYEQNKVLNMNTIMTLLTKDVFTISNYTSIDLVCLSIWFMGFFIEAIADYQKRNFRSNPNNKDKFITIGLWKYSRHPNYLGQIILAWSLSIYCFIHTGGEFSFLFLAPLFETWLLLRLSGIPLLEKANDKKWNNDSNYQQYKRNTAILIPFIW